MEIREIVKNLRKYEVRIRKGVQSSLQGNFKSIFKGAGIEFDDIRPYQYGDDIRAINWNVTAKGHGAYIKTFKEEKDQYVYFLTDVSASEDIGVADSKKIDIIKQITGVLVLSAVKESSHIGLLSFSDQRELYISAKKGIHHAYEIIIQLFKYEPKSKKTNISKAIRTLLSILKRRSMVILLSDFIDEGYEQNLKLLAKKHDVLIIHVNDFRESNFPKLGIVPVLDKETGKTLWINSSSGAYSSLLKTQTQQNIEHLTLFCKRNNISYLHLNTNEDFVPKLIHLFKLRNSNKKNV